MKKLQPSKPRGLALIVVLSILVITTILIIAFTISMRTERQAALSMSNDQGAKLLTQNALEHAISLLDSNIPQPVPPGQSTANATNWIVNPGLLTVFSGADGQAKKEIPLSSNPNTTYTPGPGDANLNQRAARKNADNTYYYPILPDSTPMKVAWVNVLKDPLSPASKSNPIVGRYAFWIDDESAKINVNVAYGKPPLANMSFDRVNPLWNPSVSSLDFWGTTSPQNSPHAAEPDNPAGGPPVYTYYADIATAHQSDPNGQSPPPPQAIDLYADPTKKITQDLMANAVGTPQAPGGQDARRFFPLWHPSAINLDVLGPPFDSTASSSSSPSARDSLADWIYNGTKSFGKVGIPKYRLLTTIDQIKQFVPSNAEAFFQKNKFYLTTASRDPEFNVFGKPRIYLDRQYPEYFDPTSFTQPNPSQPIFFQADFDSQGPTYFHGYENWDRVLGPSPVIIPNITGIQHTADAISDLLNRNDWPGMPTRSFVDKWGGGSTGAREADQVAWNIAIMGNYAQIPMGNGSGFDHGWFEGIEPTSNWLLTPVDSSRAASTKWPGNNVRTGKLSGKAIVPWIPRPMANKIVLVITPEPPGPPQSGWPSWGYPPTFSGTQPYRLKVTSQMEFTLPIKVPLVDIKDQFKQTWALTYLDYTASGQDQTGAIVSVSQTATNYSAGNGIGHLSGAMGPNPWSRRTFIGTPVSGTNPGPIKHYPMKNTVTQIARPDSYSLFAMDLPAFNDTNHREFYIRNQTGGFTDGSALSVNLGDQPNPFDNSDLVFGGPYGPYWAPQGCTMPTLFVGNVHITGHMRVAICTSSNLAVQQLIPVCDKRDGSAALDIPGQSDAIYFDFNVDLASLGGFFAGGQSVTRTIQISDPRLGGLADSWSMIDAAPSKLDGSSDDMGKANPTTTGAVNAGKMAYFDSLNEFYNESPRGSIGMLSVVPTGMQRGKLGETLKFQPSTNKSDLPDWLLLDILGPSIWPHTYMNSTLGKVNINANIFPDFGIQRWAPLQAVFQNMPNVGGAGAPSLNVNDASNVVRNIIDHNLSGQDFGAQGRYDYVGELCEVAGVADTGTSDWDKEVLIRNLANILTVRSNVFKVYGVAQTIKKRAGNTNHGTFEATDLITGEKRFEAVVDRTVWPGRDGVPGNGHVSSSGLYDLAAVQPSPTPSPTPPVVPWSFPIVPKQVNNGQATGAGQWAVIDGPDSATYQPTSSGVPWATTRFAPSSLDQANNPLRAVMKYRVLSFNYLSDY